MMEALPGSIVARSAFLPEDSHGVPGARQVRINFRPRDLHQRGIWSRFSTLKAPRVSAFAATAESEESNQLVPADDPVLPVVSTTFVLEKKCEYGESFVVAGDHELLGAWDPGSAPPMTWTEGHFWKCQIDLPAEKDYEYKFVLTGKDVEPHWQPGPNRKFATRELESPLIVSESWGDGAEHGVEEEVADIDENVVGDIVEPVANETTAGDGALETKDEVDEPPESEEKNAENEPVVAAAAALVKGLDEVISPLIPSAENEPVEGVATESATSDSDLDSDSSSESGSDEEATENELSSALEEEVRSSGKEAEQVENGQPEVPFVEVALASTLLKDDEDEKTSGNA